MIDPNTFFDGRVQRALAFAAHPDDLDFGAAGTIAAMTRSGIHVEYCVMTDGDAGGFDKRSAEEITRLRQEEQRIAARRVGVQTVHFMGERDGFLEPNHAVLKKVVRLIRQVRPELVLAMHPERNWDRIQRSHPDHLACGEAVTRAVYPAVENPFSYPELLSEEGLEAYKLPWLWLYCAPHERENLFVDITGDFESKLEALRAHFTQHPDISAMENFVKGQCQKNAERSAVPGAVYAEAFHAVTVNTDDTIAGF